MFGVSGGDGLEDADRADGCDNTEQQRLQHQGMHANTICDMASYQLKL